jgi:hypothetical protein
MATIGRALNDSFYIKAKMGVYRDAFGMTGNLFEGQFADHVSVGLTYNWYNASRHIYLCDKSVTNRWSNVPRSVHEETIVSFSHDNKGEYK